ncbi:MAG: acetylornithine/succinylornithine family transaminase [Clostridia bacterium]|nr:acetylornithine/succinylornithine family transaminase [Clostridia bacterium]
MNIFESDKKYIANTYNRFPVELVAGKGSELFDANGKRYLDMGSGIAVNIFGIADDDWCAAVTAQLTQLQHTSNLYYTDPCVTLAQKLCEKTGMKKVFFGNSGAEANEGAIKAARRYSVKKYGEGRNVIITLKNSFHGRTLATLAATGQDVFHHDFGPFPAGFVYAEPNDFTDVKTLCETNNVCAVMLEMIQGEGGVCPLEADFVQSVADYCKANDLVLIVDEVQTGNGRTGALYAYMHYGIQPDIVTTAKGLGGGLPLGAVLLGEKCEFALEAGTHGSTFGGNPVCCAGAISILDRLTPQLLAEVLKKSDYIVAELEQLPRVRSIAGKGLMLGIEFDRPGAEIAAACLEKGLLVLTAKNKVRLLPALNIPWDVLREAVDILESCIA